MYIGGSLKEVHKSHDVMVKKKNEEKEEEERGKSTEKFKSSPVYSNVCLNFVEIAAGISQIMFLGKIAVGPPPPPLFVSS